MNNIKIYFKIKKTYIKITGIKNKILKIQYFCYKEENQFKFFKKNHMKILQMQINEEKDR